MSKGRQLVLLNACLLLGIGLSIFIVPGNTPFWLWTSVAAAFLCILNATTLFRGDKPTDQTSGARRTRTTIIFLAMAFLLVDLLLSRYFAR
jgi:hypothetical protein